MNIVHPTLLLNRQRCKDNIRKMNARAAHFNLSFKPHFKTHQSKAVGQWFREEGVSGITVSSIAMAQYFAEDGWKDITIAFPVNPLAMDEINTLAEKVQLTLLVDNVQVVDILSARLTSPVDILIELDAGSRRTGVDVAKYDYIKQLVHLVSSVDKMRWKGFYSHFGHTYRCRGKEEVNAVFTSSMAEINKMLVSTDLFGVEIHIGDTPGCSLTDSFEGVTTITAGNFVFYDVMQHEIGSCSASEIAVAMACPVVSKNEDRMEICFHGGAVHFSKDNVIIDGKPCFGIYVPLMGYQIGTPEFDHKVIAISQEHGILKVSKELFERTEIGDIIGILPIHSCLTAQCMKGYYDPESGKTDHM